MEREKKARNDEIRSKHAAGASRMELIVEYRLSPARIGQILNPEIQKRYNAKKTKEVSV
jgi:Mor family transcriptional regulator